ncbi:flagellin [Jannaschia marina]|uniref:flagellin n=1 Tax=Jannaschia marina TaxID=2741674 RepID=UPI0015CC5D39|nr:flagellin [Jannaschia marina]
MLTKTALLPLLSPRDTSIETRAQIDRLSEELASGRGSDTGRALRADFSGFSRAAHALRTLEARETALSRGASWLSAAQDALATLETAGAAVSQGFGATFFGGTAADLSALAGIASGRLSDALSALSGTHGGRALFANGDASGAAPLDTATFLSDIETLARGSGDPGSLLQAFDSYFTPGGGFDLVLSGAPPDPVRISLGEGTALEVPLALGDPEIRTMLRDLAVVASLDEAGFAMGAGELNTLGLELPRRAAEGQAALARKRGEVGAVEARVDDLADRLAQDRLRFEQERSDAVGVDAFDVANRLQNEMTRLETIYSVTARRSRLRLTDYLR